MRRALLAASAVVVLVAAAVATATAAASPYFFGPDVKVSGGSTLNGCPFGASPDFASAYNNTEVEPQVAVNPLNPAEITGVSQQDRWPDHRGEDAAPTRRRWRQPAHQLFTLLWPVYSPSTHQGAAAGGLPCWRRVCAFSLMFSSAVFIFSWPRVTASGAPWAAPL